ncbi:MAG: hypothetical protein IPJ81_17350 [Chitinophagaceae bacterium]|nr:hypothetical protein [Chitinophagaceae bacterium]
MTIVIVDKIIVVAGTVVLLIAFILAFKLRKRKDLPIYFSFFYWIPFNRLLISLNTFLGSIFKIVNQHNFIFFQNWLNLAEYLLVSLFFFKLFKKGNINILIKIIFIVILALIAFLFYINDLYSWLPELYSVYNFGIFIFCLYYYYKLINDAEPTLKLWADPTFWIVTGLFLYAAITLPLFALKDYLWANFGVLVAYITFVITNVIIIVEYLLFIKAFRAAKDNVNNTDKESV